MSILTGPRIVELCDVGRITISPFDDARVNPNSYNCALDNRLMIYKKALPFHEMRGNVLNWPLPAFEVEPLDMAVDEETIDFVIPPEGFVLYPWVMYLGATVEVIATQDYVPVIDGRSSVGRLAVKVHETAGYGDHGFDGTFTLELTCTHPIRVYAGVEICQVSFHTLEGGRKPYKGKYMGQTGPRKSGLWRELQSRVAARPPKSDNR